MIEYMRNATHNPKEEKNAKADVAFIGRKQNDMVEYKEEDAKALANALMTLIRKCAENKTYELGCTITLGNMELDCCFMYSPREDVDSNKQEVEHDI